MPCAPRTAARAGSPGRSRAAPSAPALRPRAHASGSATSVGWIISRAPRPDRTRRRTMYHEAVTSTVDPPPEGTRRFNHLPPEMMMPSTMSASRRLESYWQVDRGEAFKPDPLARPHSCRPRHARDLRGSRPLPPAPGGVRHEAVRLTNGSHVHMPRRGAGLSYLRA